MSEFYYAMHHAPVPKRSGEIIGCRTDRPLDDFGRQLAKKRAEKIYRSIGNGALLAIDRIITSPLARAIETSEIIANECGIPDISIDDRAIAQCFGELEGLTTDEIMDNATLRYNLWEYIDEGERDSHRAPEAESNEDVIQRVDSLSKDIITCKEQSLLITHGTVIDSIISQRDNMPMHSIEGKNRQYEGRIIVVADNNYSATGSNGEQFDFIPDVEIAINECRSYREVLTIAEKYLDEKVADSFERTYLFKLIALAEKYNG